MHIAFSADLIQIKPGALMQPRPVQPAPAFWQVRQAEVFSHAQIGAKRKFLVDNRHTGALGFQRGMKPPPDAFNFQAPLIRPVNARKYLAQGAFARAIFAHDRVATSSGDVKTDVLERDRPRKSFANAAKTNGVTGSFGTQENSFNSSI
jgi:hypothetical protein